jgi:hypothetical protein
MVAKLKSNGKKTMVNLKEHGKTKKRNEMRVTFCCTLPVSLAEQVESIVNARRTNRSVVLNELITNGIATLS